MGNSATHAQVRCRTDQVHLSVADNQILEKRAATADRARTGPSGHTAQSRRLARNALFSSGTASFIRISFATGEVARLDVLEIGSGSRH
jgi:hypothetical protein